LGGVLFFAIADRKVALSNVGYIFTIIPTRVNCSDEQLLSLLKVISANLFTNMSAGEAAQNESIVSKHTLMGVNTKSN